MACAKSSPCQSPTKSIVKLFYTTYSEDFFNERETLKKQIIPDLVALCDSHDINLKCYSIKWGGDREKRDVLSLEKLQTSIENCYYDKITTIFINFTSDSLCWVPMWCDYPESLIENYMEVYSLLFEDFDVMREAYKPEHNNSLFLIRNDSFMNQVPGDERGMFTAETDVSKKLWEQGDHISKNFPPYRIHRYSCCYSGTNTRKQKPKLDFGLELRNKIMDFVKDSLRLGKADCENSTSNNPYTATKLQHQSLMEEWSNDVFGRDDTLHEIESYILQKDRDVPLLLLGDAGEGKSSVMCKGVRHIDNKVRSRHLQMIDGQNWYVFYHFVGAASDSRNIKLMLKRLLTELDVLNELSSKSCNEPLTHLCHNHLSNANSRPLIIFIDALDHFTDDPISTVMAWLPRKLSPRVRCIFSLTPNSQSHTTLKKRETKAIELLLPPLDMKTRQCIVSHLMRGGNRQLHPDQLNQLISKSSNPLWLTIACNELLLSYDPLDTLISHFPESLELLLDEVLLRLEHGPNGPLLVATLCLLQASYAGLLKNELLAILGNNRNICPPSPFEEKEEKEVSEKDVHKQRCSLSVNEWNCVYDVLKRFLLPYGNDSEGRLDFSHRAISDGVRQKYLPKKESPVTTEGDSEGVCYVWWHTVLADYFMNVDNFDRYIEEYPYQLCCVDDKWRLAKCLCESKVFDALYSEEYSFQLLSYWRKVGSSTQMVDTYREKLSVMEMQDFTNLEEISLRYEKVCRIVVQSGKFIESLELLKTAMKIEERELGARPFRMVELYALMADIYDEKLKLNDFVSRSQLPDLRKTVTYGRKSIALRKQFTGEYHKLKLAMSLMKLAFSLECWEACGGGPEMSGEEALAEGNKYIDIALEQFRQLNDLGHYAEALMTKGVLASRGSMEQLKFYNEAKDLCLQVYGEYHILASRLYINIGIVYEDRGQFKRAYEYFKLWAKVSEEIYGADHPKTQRARGVLKERRYRRIAQSLDDWDYEGNQRDPCDESDEVDIEEEESIVDLYDDIVQAVADLSIEVGTQNDSIATEDGDYSSFNISNCAEILATANHETNNSNQLNFADDHTVIRIGDNRENDTNADINQVVESTHRRLSNVTSGSETDDDRLLQSYFDEDRDNNDDDADENLDSNSYDDNFDDYDEQYIMHLEDSGPNIDDFNVEHTPSSGSSSTFQHDNSSRY